MSPEGTEESWPGVFGQPALSFSQGCGQECPTHTRSFDIPIAILRRRLRRVGGTCSRLLKIDHGQPCFA